MEGGGGGMSGKLRVWGMGYCSTRCLNFRRPTLHRRAPSGVYVCICDLCVCMCVCVCVRMCVYSRESPKSPLTNLSLQLCFLVSVSASVSMPVFVSVCVYLAGVFMCVCVHLYTHVCLRIHVA